MSSLDECSWPSLLAARIAVWERCYPGGDGKACPRAGGGPATAGVLCCCLPPSSYSPKRNVLLALSSSLLYCTDSELFIVSCN